MTTDTNTPYRLAPMALGTLREVAALPRGNPRPETHPDLVCQASAIDAARMLTSQGGGDSRDDRERVQDALTDLRHLCDALDLDFDDLVETSGGHHAAEIRGVL